MPAAPPASPPTPPAEATPPAPGKPAVAPEPAAPEKAAGEPEPPPPPSADALVREAQQAWLRGHFAAAIGKAESALEAQPTQAQTVRAYEIIGTCSCSIGQVDTARKAASHLGEAKREMVKAVCKKHGLTLD